MVDDITRGDEFHTHPHVEEMYYFIRWKAAKSIGTAMDRVPGGDMASSLNLIGKGCLMVLLLEQCAPKPISALMCINSATEISVGIYCSSYAWEYRTWISFHFCQSFAKILLSKDF